VVTSPARSNLGRPSLERVALTLLAIALSIIFLYPFIWSIFSSLKGPQEIYLIPPRLIPSQFFWSNYARLQQLAPFARFYANSVTITGIALVGTLISTVLVSYGFARFQFKGRNLLFLLVIGTMILPPEVTIVPRFILYNSIGWIDTWLPLTVPDYFAVSGFLVFLLRQFIMSLPTELDEAAEIDGASTFTVLTHVLLPLMKPVLATVAVFAFLASWNDFMGPLIFLRTTELFPLSVGLRFFQTGADVGGEPREAYMAAASLLMSLPPMVLFIFAQRYYIQGIVFSGLKR
jgi:multiple sugar transport system permease protein